MHPPGCAIVFDYVYRAMIDMLARIDPANVPAAARPSVQRLITKSDGTQVGAQALADAMPRMAQRAQTSAGQAGPAMSPDQMREQQRLTGYHLAEAVVVAP
jgi:hypothetical protein